MVTPTTVLPLVSSTKNIVPTQSGNVALLPKTSSSGTTFTPPPSNVPKNFQVSPEIKEDIRRKSFPTTGGGAGGGGTITTSPTQSVEIQKEDLTYTGLEQQQKAQMSAAQLTSAYAKEQVALRKAAGTYGQDIGYAKEKGILGGTTFYTLTKKGIENPSTETIKTDTNLTPQGIKLKKFITEGLTPQGYPLIESVKKGYITAEFYLTAPLKGLYTGLIEPTGKLIAKGEQYLPTKVLGTNIGEQKLSSFIYATESFVPKSIPEIGLFAFGESAYRYAPKLTSAAFGGLGIYSLSKAETPIQIASAELQLGLAGLGFYESGFVTDIFRRRGMEKIPLAELDVKPFIRTGETVYMKRYTGLKPFEEPKSIIEYLKGYEKGQFTERQYRLVAPEVQAAYEGKSEVTAFFREGDLIKLKTIKTTPFPYDEPSTHYKYFKELGFQEYPIPKKSLLPIKAKEYGFGVSATGAEWGDVFTIGEAGQYYSGKGVSVRFLRLAGEEKLSSGMPKEITSSKPTVYAGYFKEVVKNPALKEITVPNPYEVGGKPIKKYVFSKPIKEGRLEIPLFKREVEGVIFGERVPIRRKFYFKLGGRTVLIEEQTFKASLSEKELTKFKDKSFLKEAGLTEKNLMEARKPQSSTLPPIEKSYIPQAYSFKKSFLSSISLSQSSISKVSDISISRISRPSKISRTSFTSTISKPSRISRYSQFDISGTSYMPPSYPPSKPPIRRLVSKQDDWSLLGFKKPTTKKGRLRDDYSLTPSFTARQLGIKQIIKEKDLFKIVSRGKTGFEIRGIPVIK